VKKHSLTPLIVFAMSCAVIVSSAIERFISPMLWKIPQETFTILLPKVERMQDADNYVYIAFLSLYFLSWFIGFGISYVISIRSKKGSLVIKLTALWLTFYLCIAVMPLSWGATWGIPVSLLLISVLTLVTLLRSDPWVFELSILILLFLYGYKYIIGAVFGFEYMTHHDPLGLRYIAVGITALVFLLSKYKPFRSKVLLILGVVAVCIGLSNLMVAPQIWTRDYLFTLVPAYQLTRGATPLVNMVSQYGILYLAPWVVLFTLVPHIPITMEMTTVMTTCFLIIYYIFFAWTLWRLRESPLVAVLTLSAAFYWGLGMRMWVFNDASSLLAPAFTPLRFGFFIIPLFFLARYLSVPTNKNLVACLVTGCIALFFSADVGVGIFIAVTFAFLFDSFCQSVKQGFWMLRLLIGVDIVVSGLILFIIFIRSGGLPNVYSYLIFIRLFQSGIYMTPVGGAIGFHVPLVIALAGFFYGAYILWWEKKKRGIVFIYLSVVQLFALMYYMGRSLPQTLVSVSIPALVLCGLIADEFVTIAALKKRQVGLFVFGFGCLYIITVGALKSLVNIATYTVNPRYSLVAKKTYITTALSTWDIKNTAQVTFLKQTLPNGCPIIVFDEQEAEIMTALGVPPATDYPFLDHMVVTKEQINALQYRYSFGRFCVFVNDSKQEYFLRPDIKAIWDTIKNRAKIIAQDSERKFSLYEVVK
jgi:hypothetical protein